MINHRPFYWKTKRRSASLFKVCTYRSPLRLTAAVSSIYCLVPTIVLGRYTAVLSVQLVSAAIQRSRFDFSLCSFCGQKLWTRAAKRAWFAGAYGDVREWTLEWFAIDGESESSWDWLSTKDPALNNDVLPRLPIIIALFSASCYVTAGCRLAVSVHMYGRPDLVRQHVLYWHPFDAYIAYVMHNIIY